MEEKKKEYFKKLLLQLRNNIVKQMENSEEGLGSTLKDSAGEHSSYSFHLADLGTDTGEREKSFLIASMGSEVLREIDHTFKKFDIDEYGICEQCGQEINQQRLEAIPHSKLCLDCKSQEEITR